MTAAPASGLDAVGEPRDDPGNATRPQAASPFARLDARGQDKRPPPESAPAGRHAPARDDALINRGRVASRSS
jgi:hypothetical protein